MKVGVLMEGICSEQPYTEGALKAWVRTHCASRESRMGVPKEDAWYERLLMRIYCTMAVAYFLIAMVFPPASSHAWTQAAVMAMCVVWCALAGVFESACEWQRASMRWAIDSAPRDLSQPPTHDDIAMLDSLADIRDASDDEVDDALRREFGD